MKSCILIHNSKPKHVVMLSYWDMICMLFGKEILVHDIFVIRKE
jgi:hypothetical protein